MLRCLSQTLKRNEFKVICMYYALLPAAVHVSNVYVQVCVAKDTCHMMIDCYVFASDHVIDR